MSTNDVVTLGSTGDDHIKQIVTNRFWYQRTFYSSRYSSQICHHYVKPVLQISQVKKLRHNEVSYFITSFKRYFILVKDVFL